MKVSEEERGEDKSAVRRGRREGGVKYHCEAHEDSAYTRFDNLHRQHHQRNAELEEILSKRRRKYTK